MPPKTRHQIREQESRGQPATPPTSLPIPNRRPRRAATREPTTASEAPPGAKPQRGRRRKATPAQAIAEPSTESATSASATEHATEYATEAGPESEQGTAVVTGSPERDSAVYQNRENPTVSLNPALVPEDAAVRSPRETASFSLNPTMVPEDNAVPSPHERTSSPLNPILANEDDAVLSPHEKASVTLTPAPKGQWPRTRQRRLRNAFTFYGEDGQPLTLRDRADVEAPQNTLHVLVTGPNGDRTMSFTLPATAADAVVENLINNYELLTDAPKLTLDTGKREAPTNVEPSDARPTQQPRFENAPSFDNALQSKVSHPNWPHLKGEYYQQRQDKFGHTQHYRMVQPFYDENGMLAWPKDEERRFIPILDDLDDSDLDTELDEASSSFKENIPAISEDKAMDNIEDSEPSGALVNGSGAGAHDLEEDAMVLQENEGVNENAQVAVAAQNPQTPRSRWALGNIINTASRYIPRLGRVAEDPPPIQADPVAIHPTEGPATPIQPALPAQHITARTEPRHRSRASLTTPRTEPRRPTRISSAGRPDIKRQPNTTVSGYQIHAAPRTKEERARLNVQRRQEKVKKRQELEQIPAKKAELDRQRAAIQNEMRALQRLKAESEASKEEREAREAKIKETYELPAVDGFKLKLRSVQKLDKQRVKGPLFGPPREPNAPGSRIKEARAEAKRKRRELSPKVIPGPAGGGYGMNEKYFYDSESDYSDDTATDSPRAKKARLEEAKDSSLPVGDPHKARPAMGAYVNDEADEPQLHGGNVFREVDATEETIARAAKAKGSVPKMAPMTPDGRQITNLSGHFTVPYSSDSETGSDEDAVDNSTPAPKRSVKESLSEMSMFRNDAREIEEREDREIEEREAREARQRREAREAREREFQEARARATAEKYKDWPQNSYDPPRKSTDSPARTDSLPPIPPAPTPAHASLPQHKKYIPGPGFKTSERTLKFLRDAQLKTERLRNEEAKVKAARAQALQFTPRRPSNLRESHLVDGSPPVPAGQSATGPSAPSVKRVHFADDLISGPSGSTVSDTSRTTILTPSKTISEPSPIVSDPSQAGPSPPQASSEIAQVVNGPAQSSETALVSPGRAPTFPSSAPVFPGPAQVSSGHTPVLSRPAQAYPGPTQSFARPTRASPGSSSSFPSDRPRVDCVPNTRYSKNEMVDVHGMQVRGEVLNYALDAIRNEDVEYELGQIRNDLFDEVLKNPPSRRPEVTPRVQDFLNSEVVRKAIEEDTDAIADGIRAGMARDFPL
ncbi:MAG: hypothetical protein Q9195_006325 [Heterodermia aff. obscurata]